MWDLARCTFLLVVDVPMQREDRILNCNMLNTEDSLGYGIQDKEAVAMIGILPLGVGIN